MASSAWNAEQDLLLFEVAGVRYALPSRDVRELVRAVTIVPLPKAPPIVEGVINVRGAIVPVLDLRSRFRLPMKPLVHSDHLILAWAGPRLVAIRADRVLGLSQLAPGACAAAQAIAPSAEYVVGVAKLGDGLALIHDLATFLAAAESAAIEDALGARSSLGDPP